MAALSQDRADGFWPPNRPSLRTAADWGAAAGARAPRSAQQGRAGLPGSFVTLVGSAATMALLASLARNRPARVAIVGLELALLEVASTARRSVDRSQVRDRALVDRFRR